MSRQSRIRVDYRKSNKLGEKWSVPKPSGENLDYCKELDNMIKQLEITILNEHNKQLTWNARPSARETIEANEMLLVLRDILKARQITFNKTSCVAKLENAKLLETKAIATAGFKDYETDVLSGTNKESKQLFIIGGVVLLLALGIILYSTKKKK